MIPTLFLVALLGVLTVAEDVDYHDQTHWEGFCQTGKRQSPIDINETDTDTCGNVKFAVNFWDGMTAVYPITTQPSNLFSEFPSSVLTIVDIDGNILEYVSAQYHMHVGSEHRFNGVQSALELHLVHKLYGLFQNVNNYAVVGLMFDIDQNPTTNLFDQIDFTTTQRVNFKTIFGPMIAPNAAYHYQGSFTTPTCGEVVNWFVMQKRFPIRQAQLDAIAAAINNHEHNAREAQALNGRKVRLVSASCNIDMPVVSYNLVSPGLSFTYGSLLQWLATLLVGVLLIA